MKKIICDTDIWYHIAAGRISQELIKGLPLVATWNSVSELAKSPYLSERKTIPLVIGASKALVTHAVEIDMQPSIEKIIKKYCPEFIPNTKIPEELLQGIKIFADLEVDKIEDETIEKMRISVDENRSPMEEAMVGINEMLLQVRQNIKQGIGKPAHKAADGKEGIQEHIASMASDHMRKNYTTDIDFQNLTISDPLLTVFSFFYKTLELDESRKFRLNDWMDLFNLAYVDDNSLYWTRETYWLRIIQDAGMGHFLFKRLGEV